LPEDVCEAQPTVKRRPNRRDKNLFIMERNRSEKNETGTGARQPTQAGEAVTLFMVPKI
jgi:hypothetical protein